MFRLDRPSEIEDRWGRAPLRCADAAEAFAMFDRAAPVDVDAMRGTWQGSEVHTGHPMDGMLEAFGWFGKRVDDRDAVFPLLFGPSAEEAVAIEPALVPVRLAVRLRVHERAWAVEAFRRTRALLRTRTPSARMRMMQCRGVPSATIVYDALPILDVFREVAPGRLLGLMDSRYFAVPFFFALRRV